MYLLDTNVVSELRKAKRTDKNVRVWAGGVPTASLFLSVITLLEIEIGILRDARARKPRSGSRAARSAGTVSAGESALGQFSGAVWVRTRAGLASGMPRSIRHR